jgi:hypothetical protein
LHDLIVLDSALPGALTTAEIDRTMAYAEAEKAAATREVERWRSTLSANQRFEWASPEAVHKHCPAFRKPEGDGEPAAGTAKSVTAKLIETVEERPAGPDRGRGREEGEAGTPPGHRDGGQLMHDLILPAKGGLPPGFLSDSEIADAMEYAEKDKAESTRKIYRRDWETFAAWCLGRGGIPLPAHPGIVGAYLSGLAKAGQRPSTIGRKAAAIA